MTRSILKCLLVVGLLLLLSGCGRHIGFSLVEADADRFGDFVEVTAVVRCTPLGYTECYFNSDERVEVCVVANWLDENEELVMSGESCRALRLLEGEEEVFVFRSSGPVEAGQTLQVNLSSAPGESSYQPIVLTSP